MRILGGLRASGGTPIQPRSMPSRCSRRRSVRTSERMQWIDRRVNFQAGHAFANITTTEASRKVGYDTPRRTFSRTCGRQPPLFSTGWCPAINVLRGLRTKPGNEFTRARAEWVPSSDNDDVGAPGSFMRQTSRPSNAWCRGALPCISERRRRSPTRCQRPIGASHLRPRPSRIPRRTARRALPTVNNTAIWFTAMCQSSLLIMATTSCCVYCWQLIDRHISDHRTARRQNGEFIDWPTVGYVSRSRWRRSTHAPTRNHSLTNGAIFIFLNFHSSLHLQSAAVNLRWDCHLEAMMAIRLRVARVALKLPASDGT